MTHFDESQIRDNFYKIEETLQILLPGSGYAQRYTNTGSVGLALVAGSPRDLRSTSLLDWSGQPPILNNLQEHPETWNDEGVDYQALLGHGKPLNLGRYDAFALAKAVRLAQNPHMQSSFGLEVNQGKGQVGLAGGINTGRSIVAISGLWELHDDAATRYYIRNFIGLPKMGEDQITEELGIVLSNLASRHSGIAVEDLTRRELQVLVNMGTVQRAA